MSKIWPPKCFQISVSGFLILTVLVGVCLVSGCASQGPDSDGPSVAGVYGLVAVDKQKLPATISHGESQLHISSGTFTIRDDGTCESRITFGHAGAKPFTREVQATYTQDGATLNMKWEGAGTTVGMVEGPRFTMVNEGMEFVYQILP